jgi:hypothetical protein
MNGRKDERKKGGTGIPFTRSYIYTFSRSPKIFYIKKEKERMKGRKGERKKGGAGMPFTRSYVHTFIRSYN